MPDEENYSEKETAERMAKALKKSFAMPPAPFTPKKKKEDKPKKKARPRSKSST